MTSTQGNLLWIEYDGSARPQSHETRSALKQHVMLNFLDKKAPVAQEKALARRKSPLHEERIANARRILLQPLVCPQPRPALVCHEDQLVYRAAWWHTYVHPDFATVPSHVPTWQNDCKQRWKTGFWGFARMDETLLEVFMAYAAAKEAAVKRLPDAPAFYRHRGKALTLLSEDVDDEGHDLRLGGILAIAFLCYTYLIEGDYGSAELHCQALAKLAPTCLHRVPDTVWQLMVSMDMYLTTVLTRAPSMPYHMHEDFRTLYFYNPNETIVKATLDNLTKLPIGSVFSEEQAARTKRLIQGIHGLAHAERRFDISWNAPWANIYDASYLLSQLQMEVGQHGSLEEHIIVIGCQMQLFGMMIVFCEQTDIQNHLLHRLEQAIASIDPGDLCNRWLEYTGSLDWLLWALCNAGVSVLQLTGCRSLATGPLPEWLQPAVGYILEHLQLTEPDDLRARLQQMPYTETWNGRACQSAPVWSNTRIATPTPGSRESSPSYSHQTSSKFERLRRYSDWLET